MPLRSRRRRECLWQNSHKSVSKYFLRTFEKCCIPWDERRRSSHTKVQMCGAATTCGDLPALEFLENKHGHSGNNYLLIVTDLTGK